jgi:hypothetical protein
MRPDWPLRTAVPVVAEHRGGDCVDAEVGEERSLVRVKLDYLKLDAADALLPASPRCPIQRHALQSHLARPWRHGAGAKVGCCELDCSPERRQAATEGVVAGSRIWKPNY